MDSGGGDGGGGDAKAVARVAVAVVAVAKEVAERAAAAMESKEMATAAMAAAHPTLVYHLGSCATGHLWREEGAADAGCRARGGEGCERRRRTEPRMRGWRHGAASLGLAR